MMVSLRQGSWLDRGLVTRIAAANALLTIAMLLFLYVTAHGTLDPYGRPLGTDFSVFWNAGHLANIGHAPDAWDPNRLNAAAHAMHGGDVGDSAWLYPPLFLFVATTLAHIPYVPALILWQLLSLALIASALAQILPDRRALLVALASPLSWMVLAHGQNAFLTAALLAWGLILAGRKPLSAGGLLGCLAYKPQLAIILGPALLVSRQWRTALAALVAAALLCAVSLSLWGLDSWHAFLGSLRLGRGFMEIGAVGFYKSASLFAMARQWGANLPVSYAVQAAGLIGGFALVWRLRNADPLVRAAGTCVAATLSTPYLLDYDMATAAVGAAFLYAAAARDGFLPYDKWAFAFIWFEPWLARPAAQYLTLPLGPAAMLVIASLALRRAGVTASPSRHSHGSSAP